MADAIPVKTVERTYVLECAGIAAFYIGTVLARPFLIAHAPDEALALAATLLPILPTWLLFAAAWRYYRRIDEYKRQRFLEVVSLSFGIGACAIVSYGFLTDAGLPRLGFDWAWPILGLTWALVSVVHEILTCR